MSTSPTVPPAGGALVRLAGADALSLLHRISTAALEDLAPGSARPTLFCDFRGRLLHRAVVAVTVEGTAWLLRDDAPGDALIAFVDRSVFREDVRLDDLGGDRHVRTVAAPAGFAPGTLHERDGLPRLVSVDSEVALAVGDGPAPPVADADEPGRIAAARPRHGHEIAEEFTPFEVGLAHEVHLRKGCYTGQEALMRLVTYRSVRRTLVVVAGTGAAPEVPADLTRDGQRAGRLTSASAELGGWIGLAVVAHEAAVPDGTLALADDRAVRVRRVVPVSRALGLPTG